jgi:hypothetical protein
MELNNAIADALVKMEEQKNQMSMLVASEGCKAGNQLWMFGLLVSIVAAAMFMRLG